MSRSRKKSLTKKQQIAAIVLTAVLAISLTVAQPLLDSLGIDLNAILAMVYQQPVTVALPSEGTAEVHFIDVGQASSILVVGSQGTALIDGGESGDAQTVIDYLNAHGVTELDWFFGTHPHSDHIGGCRQIMQSIPTANFVQPQLNPDTLPTTVTYSKLLEYLAQSSGSTQSVQAAVGDVYELGDGLLLTVLGPVAQYEELNSQSLVLRMDFGATSFLFTGDMEQESQQDMLAAGGITRVTLVGVPHHGSDTSIDSDFLRRLSPDYAVISCGAGNDYGHPHAETLELYDRLQAELYRTDRQGSVQVVTDGQKLTVTTERSG